MAFKSRTRVTYEEMDTPRSVYLEKRLSCSSIPFSPFNDGFPRLTLSYQKLPPHFIKLSVLKLDGTSFDVQVVGTVSVGELKQAVEDVFAHSPKKGEQGTISWSHVWSHFCLCYGNEKLNNDKDSIRSFGIRDGDQLHFIRHLSINYKSVERKCRKKIATFKEQPICWAGEEKEESNDGYVKGDLEVGFKNYQHEDEEFIGHPQFKVAHFLKGLLSHSRLWFVGKSKSHHRVQPGHFLKIGSKMTFAPL